MDTQQILNQQAAEQAPPVATPSTVASTVADVRESKKEEPKETPENTKKILAMGSESDFWRVIKEKLDAKIKRMKRAHDAWLEKGNINLADVGLRSLIINEVSNAYQELIDIVEFSKKEAVIETNTEKEDRPEIVSPDEFI